jgi:hypothetical protein
MTYNNEFDIHQRDASVFDLEYAMQLKSMYPEVWEKSGGTYGDHAFDSLIEIMNQGGMALTPEQVEVLDLRDAWISRHAKDSSTKGVLAQVKWLAVGNLGESGMKRLIASEIDVVHFKKAKQPLKDPKGGLTAAGRRHFNRTQGFKLKPGVRGPANTPEKLRRKGSFLTRFFTNPSGPMKDDKGRPTRLALSAAAWGEPVPQNAEDAAALASKGRRMLERYQNKKRVRGKSLEMHEDMSEKQMIEYIEKMSDEEFDQSFPEGQEEKWVLDTITAFARRAVTGRRKKRKKKIF